MFLKRIFIFSKLINVLKFEKALKFWYRYILYQVFFL